MTTKQAQKKTPYRKIVTAPNEALTSKCKGVGKVTPSILSLAHDMEEFLRSPPPGLDVKPIGISAPQLGVNVRMSSYILNSSTGDDAPPEIITIINPVLVYEKKMHRVTESCLSLPGKIFSLKRGKIVKIKGTLLDGTPKTLKGHGLLAQLLIHELNHLDGILISSVGEIVQSR